MAAYLIRMAILLPMVGGLAWGSLWLWRRLQTGLPMPGRPERAARVTEVITLGTGSKVAVIAFGRRLLLVGVNRTQISLIAESEADDA
jgi:flagellar protein FliO/FliZ